MRGIAPGPGSASFWPTPRKSAFSGGAAHTVKCTFRMVANTQVNEHSFSETPLNHRTVLQSKIL